MYTKITHHITEEHFAHPNAVKIKKAVDSKKKVNPKSISKTKPKSFFYFEDHDLSSTERDSINCWAQLSWRIRSLVISITSGYEDVDVLTTRLSNDIDSICAIVAPYVSAADAAQFKTLLDAVCSSLLDVIKAIKAGIDTTTLMTTLTTNIGAFATLVNSINSNWDVAGVTDIFTRVTNLYIAQAQHRLAKEWAMGVDAADQAYNMMVVTQDDGNPSFADIFSSGINDIDEPVELETY